MSRRLPQIARLTRLRRPAVLLVAATALAACAGGITDYGTGTAGQGGSATGGSATGGQATSAVVGRWWRLFTFSSGGAARTSETFWDFAADGTAKRTLITTNVTDGLAEVLVTNARWRVVAGDIDITYVSPTQGTVRFRWRVERGLDGDVLYLDETWFRRLP